MERESSPRMLRMHRSLLVVAAVLVLGAAPSEQASWEPWAPHDADLEDLGSLMPAEMLTAASSSSGKVSVLPSKAPLGWSWNDLSTSLQRCEASRGTESAFMRLMESVLGQTDHLQDPLR
ncbi:hypothetical protein FOCC_FOCC008949, partial [Frankliniella occidentalis]